MPLTITIGQLEAELKQERLLCTECNKKTRTLPAEGVPAQALRYGINCEHVFFMALPDLPSSIH